MKFIAGTCMLCLSLAGSWRSTAQTYETNNVVVQTFVGSGFYGMVDGQGMQTMFYNPSAIVVDSSGNFFVLDSSNYRIRKVTPDGTVTTFVGGGQGGLPGYGTNVSLANYTFNSMSIDHSDVLWVTLSYSPYLLRVGTDGFAQYVPLSGLSRPWGVCADSKNDLYISDASDNKIYRFRTNWVLELFVGSGNPGSVDGNGVFNSFNSPTALAADAADNIYVWDSNNHLIRRINQNRDVSTIAGRNDIYNNSSNEDGVGTNASFASVTAMVVDDTGTLLLACGAPGYFGGGSSIRKLTASTNATTLAGSFTLYGYANGAGSNALFYGPSGVCISHGQIFVADSSNHRIRTISFDPAPQQVSGANLALNTYPGLQISGVVGRTYRVESSTDMNSWNNETALLLPRSPYLWIDENGLGQMKFYRAFLLP